MTSAEIRKIMLKAIDELEREGRIAKRIIGYDKEGNAVYEQRQSRTGEWEPVYYYVNPI